MGLYLHSPARLHGVALNHTNFAPDTIQRILQYLHFLLVSPVTLPHCTVFAIFTPIRKDGGWPTITPVSHTCYSSGYKPVGRGRLWGAASLQEAHNVAGTSYFSSQCTVRPLLRYIISKGGHILDAYILDCAV